MMFTRHWINVVHSHHCTCDLGKPGAAIDLPQYDPQLCAGLLRILRRRHIMGDSISVLRRCCGCLDRLRVVQVPQP